MTDTTTQTAEKTVSTRAYFLSVRNTQHDKQYVCFITETNAAIIQYGRYGADGTTNGAVYPTASQAETSAMKQVYKKVGERGYKYEIDGIVFLATQRAIDAALNGNGSLLIAELKEAHKNGAFKSQADAVLKHYEDFAKQANTLLEDVSAGEISAVDALQRFEGLQEAWALITKQHGETGAMLSITGRMLAGKLSGS